MNDKNTEWTPEMSEETLKALIRATVMTVGMSDPASLPFKVRERLKGQISGDLDIDHYVREILKETKGKT